MNNHQEEGNSSVEQDDHEYDTLMPGFRFHPTEEELIQFYLRRKVEGKPFNLELITFLDLYRYDPWELPGLAAIGEKEWYFYVPRDRKYRNGDRPNRVTTSGYWKATGADRMITSSSNTSENIGLKKTLVFYSGKAPKGTRTSWIMNEYRLPLHETQRLGKAEISLCRVHKRAGIDDPRWQSPIPKSDKPSSSRGLRNQAMEGSSQKTYGKIIETSLSSCSSTDNHNHAFDMINPLAPNFISFFSSSSATNDDLHNLVNLNYSQNVSLANPGYEPQPAVSSLDAVEGSLQAAFSSDRLWEWNAVSDGSKDYFK